MGAMATLAQPCRRFSFQPENPRRLRSPEHDGSLMIVRHDEDVEAYMGGTLVFSARGFNTQWTACDVTKELRAAKPGGNLAAVHVTQSTGGRHIDLGLVLDPEQRLIVPVKPIDPAALQKLRDACWPAEKAGLDSHAGWVATVDGRNADVFVQRFRFEPEKEYPDGSSVEFWHNGLGRIYAYNKWIDMPANRDDNPLGIPHPPFRTSQYYYDKIPKAAVTLPPDDRYDHPVMRYQRAVKGWKHGFSPEMVRMVRRTYFAMIAEFDLLTVPGWTLRLSVLGHRCP